MRLAWEPLEGEPRTWTYRQFLEEVERIAGGLAARGVGPGDRLLIHMNKCPQFLFAWSSPTVIDYQQGAL